MRFPIMTAALALAGLPAAAEEVEYDVDGGRFTGYFAAAEDPKGLVLIIHDWDGMTDYEKRRADMLADLGYDAFALDMFGDGTATETVEDRRAATGALYQDRVRMRRLIAAGADQAMAQSDADAMVAMGYCFGGAVTLEMARNEISPAVVGYATFHGGLSTPEGQSWPTDVPPLLIAHGGADTSVKMADVATLAGELEAADATYEIEIYSGAPHAFTVFGSDRYRERADRLSWDAFTGFLEERLGG